MAHQEVFLSSLDVEAYHLGGFWFSDHRASLGHPAGPSLLRTINFKLPAFTGSSQWVFRRHTQLSLLEMPI
jgi:hypothetical protein